MFGKLLTNQKIAHKIVKPYVYKALREGLKTHDNGKIQNLRGFGSLSLRGIYPSNGDDIRGIPTVKTSKDLRFTANTIFLNLDATQKPIN